MKSREISRSKIGPSSLACTDPYIGIGWEYQSIFKRPSYANSIQLLPLCEGNMTVCSPEAGNIVRERSPRVILPVAGERIVMLPSHKDNNCFIIPTCFIISFSL